MTNCDWCGHPGWKHSEHGKGKCSHWWEMVKMNCECKRFVRD